MAEDPLILKKVKKCDEYCLLTVRIKIELLEKLNQVAYRTNFSRNKVINLLLEHQVENIEFE